MFTHVRIGCSDVEKARAFYDATLSVLGVKGQETNGMLMYSDKGNRFIVAKPSAGAPTPANGGTIGFVAASNEAVDKFHGAGLANGGKCEGAPGPRANVGGVYAAYLRDPDGNKICALSYPQ